MAAAGEAQGEGSGSRQRRDRGNNGGQHVNGKLRQESELANQKGGQHVVSADVDRGGDRRGHGRHGGPSEQNGYGAGRGHHGGPSEGRAGGRGHGGPSGKGYRGGRDYRGDVIPPPPSWPAPEELSLTDLLMQVAPQARIAENSGWQASKAPSASGAGSSADGNAFYGGGGYGSPARYGSSGGYGDPSGYGPPASYGSPDHGYGGPRGHGSPGGYTSPGGTQPKAEDDEEFEARWSGLFSKGSPLVEGSLEDPFSDLKKRAKVVWKKNRDRPGHRQRYQDRKKQKEQEEDPDGVLRDSHDRSIDNGEPSSAHNEAADGASIVYDASQTQWQPQRPPANI